MKIIVSSDELTAINFNQIHTMCVDISQSGGYPVVIDDVEISHHREILNACKQLREIINTMKADGPIVYQAEDTK